MPRTKKVVLKKSTKSGAKAKVNVVVNVNSNNKKKNATTKIQQPQQQSSGPIYIPQFQSPNTTDGFHHLTNTLTESMAKLLNLKEKSDEKPKEPPNVIIHNYTPTPPTAPHANVAIKDDLPFQSPQQKFPSLVENAQDIPKIKSEIFPKTEKKEMNWVDPALAGPSMHHQVGYEGQDAGSYMRELAQNQRAQSQRTPPLLRVPQRRHSGTFDAPRIHRSGNVYA